MDKLDISVLLTAADSILNDSRDEYGDGQLQAAMNCVNPTKAIPKISNYAEVTVPQMDDMFKSHLRVSR